MLLITLGFSPADLENAGRLVEAGTAWQAAGDPEGQVRIICRMLEEALYAGHAGRAGLLALELEGAGAGSDLVAFWSGRTAWTAGLPVQAAEMLDSLDTNDQWLKHRATGLAALFREDGETAVRELLLSIRYGSTVRRQFWSALDLCSAYLNTGRYDEALALSEMLHLNFTGDPMADVMYGLCLHESGRYGESYRILSGVDGSSPAAEQMARALMEGFEQ